MSRFNKATAAAIGNGAAMAVGAVLGLDPEVQSAAALILTTVLVYLIPNKE